MVGSSIPAVMKSPVGKGAEVMTVTASSVVGEDCVTEHDDEPGGQVLDVDWVHDPVAVPERFGTLWGSIWKSLPEPLKSFDCLAFIPHW